MIGMNGEKYRFKSKNMMLVKGYDIIRVKIRYDFTPYHWEYREYGMVEKHNDKFIVYKFNDYGPFIELGCAKSMKDGIVAIALLNGLSAEDVPAFE